MRSVAFVAFASAALLGGLNGSAHAETRRSPIVEAVQKAKPSVVAIRVSHAAGGQDSIGSGVIIDEHGFIVTNNHVVVGAERVKVRLADGTELPGKVVVREPNCDLAIVRVRATFALKALPLAPASDLLEGETVVAIGHPYGYSFTVSRGIISALNRNIQIPGGGALAGLIQTDASINPGNSGGPLLNINGEFIGINTAVREGANGIAFAINAQTVQEILIRRLSAEAIASIDHGLGLTETVVAETGVRQHVLVTRSGEADEGGLRKGDRLVEIGARAVQNRFDVERALWDKKPNDRVPVKVLRQGRELTVTMTVSETQGAGAVAQTAPTPAASPETSLGHVTRVRGSGKE